MANGPDRLTDINRHLGRFDKDGETKFRDGAQEIFTDQALILAEELVETDPANDWTQADIDAAAIAG